MADLAAESLSASPHEKTHKAEESEDDDFYGGLDFDKLDFTYTGWTDGSDISDSEYDEYCSQVKASGGFDVDYFSSGMVGHIMPLGVGCENHRDLLIYSRLALHHYNQLKGSDFEFLEIEKANVQTCAFCKYYITFKAKNAFDGSTETFQTLVWEGMNGNHGELILEVLFCRVKPTTPTEESGSSAPPGKRQKTEESAEGGVELVDSEEEVDDSFLNFNYTGLADGFYTSDDEYKEYCRQVKGSEGFDVGNFSFFFVGQIMPLDDFSCNQDLVCVYSELALYHYLQAKKAKAGLKYMEIVKKEDLKFLEIEKTNVQTRQVENFYHPFKAKNANFYISFKVKNSIDDSSQTFQALIWRGVDRKCGKLYLQVKSCRIKPTTPCVEGNIRINN